MNATGLGQKWDDHQTEKLDGSKDRTDDIIDGKNSLVWKEAENRLYTHQSILLWCLNF